MLWGRNMFIINNIIEGIYISSALHVFLSYYFLLLVCLVSLDTFRVTVNSKISKDISLIMTMEALKFWDTSVIHLEAVFYLFIYC